MIVTVRCDCQSCGLVWEDIVITGEPLVLHCPRVLSVPHPENYGIMTFPGAPEIVEQEPTHLRME